MSEQEREVISKLIELYKDFPCLWNRSSVLYRDIDKRSVAWEILVQTLKELEPNANTASVKKKIENLKTAYKREARKVKESRKQIEASSSEVYTHKPKLWYFDLMTFLNKKDDRRKTEVDPVASDDELHEQIKLESKRKTKSDCVYERKKQKKEHTFSDATHELHESKPKKLSPFIVYIEDQLKNISTNQRHIAEKLISDVLFLAKTENLNFDSKINTNSRLTFSSPSCPQVSPPQHSPSTEFLKSDPSYRASRSPSPPSTKVISSKYASSPSATQIHQSTSTSSKHSEGKLKLSNQPPNVKNECRTPRTIESSRPSQQSSQVKTSQDPSTSQTQQKPNIIKLSIPRLSTCKVIRKTAGSKPKVTEGTAGTLLKGLLQQLQSK